MNSYINTLEKAELTASICHIARFLKSRIPIYNPKLWIQLAEKPDKKKETETAKGFLSDADATSFYINHSYGIELTALFKIVFLQVINWLPLVNELNLL